MKINKSIIGSLLNNYANNTAKGGGPSLFARLRPSRSDMIFLMLAITLIFVFFVAGIVELISTSSIGHWLTVAWNSILGSSPQTVQNAISNPPNVQLPNETVGDLFSSLGRIIISPLDWALAVLILIAAIFVRLRTYIGRVVSPERLKSFRIVSWLILTASFIPPILDLIW